MGFRLRVRTRRSVPRRGAIAVLAAVMMIVLLGFTALAIDVGYICLARTQAQACADSAALAGAWDIIGEERLRGDYFTTYMNSRETAGRFAALNRVGSFMPELRPNIGNAELEGDIVLGRIEDPSNHSENLSFADSTQYNTVFVRVQCTRARNQQIPLFFAQALGWNDFEISAEAAATFDDNVIGFRPTDKTGNCLLMPFAIRVGDWNNLVLNRGGADAWSYDAEAGTVSPGTDGIPELAMYPVDMNDSDFSADDNTGSGNWTTVDLGGGDNSTAVLERQIRDGVSPDDLAAMDGKLMLDEVTGKLNLTADTGISVGMKDALQSVVGQPRTIALYDFVSDGGNNMVYRIVGFVGVRILDHKLTGANAKRYVTIQPAYVCDPSAVTSPGIGSSYFVGKPVHLSR